MHHFLDRNFILRVLPLIYIFLIIDLITPLVVPHSRCAPLLFIHLIKNGLLIHFTVLLRYSLQVLAQGFCKVNSPF
jgi:hypothetical protein